MSDEYFGIRSIKKMNNKSWIRDYYLPKKRVKPTYIRNNLKIGFNADDYIYKKNTIPFKLNTSESSRCFVLGRTRCLPVGTLVRTPIGNKPIEDVKRVLSYNFKKDIIEVKPSIVHTSGMKKSVKIHTPKGIIVSSPEHKWFVENKGIISLKEAKYLSNEDRLIIIGET